MTERDIPNTDEILVFLHCGQCLTERPEEESPKEWARLNVGWTKLGLQVWCTRHEVNVLHIDFEGRKHPANVTAKAPHAKHDPMNVIREDEPRH
jgi:hypothetical protein